MLYTNGIKKAMKFAYAVHDRQLDKGGMPYIFHPMAVAEKMHTESEIIVALLHDVVEDSKITIGYLMDAGFSREVAEAVDAITKRKDENYSDYIARVKANPIARKVKIADLMHNMDLSRLNEVTDSAKIREDKYRKALEVLNG